MVVTTAMTNTSQAQVLNDQQLLLVISALNETGEYTQEQIATIVIALSSLEQNQSGVGTELMLDSGNVCGFRYAGDESIISIQQELQNQGYTITKIDGKIGPETRSAVKAFQSDMQAEKIDGLIGQETRNLLVKGSVACLGDAGVSASAVVGETDSQETNIGTQSICRFAYNGDESLLSIQQELQNQGYTITKIDGIKGPETRAAVLAFETSNNLANPDGIVDQEFITTLSKKSISCNFEIDQTLPNPTQEPANKEETIDNQQEASQGQNISSETEIETETETEIEAGTELEPKPSELSNFILKDEILAAVRTAGQSSDDTAVFTYRMTLNPEQNIFISKINDTTFDVNIYNQDGALVKVDQIKSILTTGQQILRKDGKSYYQIKKGDSISLRTTVQPGPGSYYAELGRFTYTADDASIVLNPKSANYELDPLTWRSGTIRLLN